MTSICFNDFIISDFLNNLEKFIKSKTEKFYDFRSQKLINDTKIDEFDIEDVIRKWEKKYKDV